MRVKEHFTSRYGEDGVIVEFDWTALEVVGFAWLTKDMVLYRLIREGINMHRYVGSFVINKPMDQITDKERKELKPSNFELIYGGNAYSLVYNKGLELEEAKKIYEGFWNAFPEAKQAYDNLYKEVVGNAYETSELTSWGVPRLGSSYQDPMGRKYCFKAYEKQDRYKGMVQKFKYAEVVNYRCQGMMTGNIHLIAVGLLFREAQKHRDKFLLINIVHDSVILDCRKEFLDEICILVRDVLQSVIQVLRKDFKLDWDLDLKVECKVGTDWANMVKYEFNRINEVSTNDD